MIGQHEDPDFVVDPSGTARDVRHSSRGFSPVPPTRPPTNGGGGHSKPPPPRRPQRTIYWIPIPIGLIIFLLVSLVRCLSPGVEDAHTIDSESAYREYTRGNQYLFGGDYDEAISFFTMALQSEPDSVDIYNARGLAYQAKGDTDSAIGDFDRALELAPDSAMVYNNRAITYQDVGDYAQAIADLTVAIGLVPNLGKAYYNRGLAYLALADYDRAIADLGQAIERSSHWTAFPTSEPSDSEFGSLLSGFGEQLEAQSYAAPLPLAYYNRGLAYAAKEEFERATAELERALELQPDWSDAKHLLNLVRAAESSDISVLLILEPTGVAWPTATDWASSLDAESAVPSEELLASIAVYVPQPLEESTTPIGELNQESCSGKPLYMWSSPGTYTYSVEGGNGEHGLVVEQRVGYQQPVGYSCNLLGVDVTSSSHKFGESLTGSSTRGTSHTVSGCLPEGALGGHSELSIVLVGTETKATEIGTFQSTRVDISLGYSITTGAHRTLGMEAQKSEWYACGYGLIHSTASSAGSESGIYLTSKSTEVTLVSYAPFPINESHVRYMLADMQLSDNVDAYRGEVADEETAEALRRWDAGVRVVNSEDFVRRVVDGEWRIVDADTGQPVVGAGVLLTTDQSQ